MKKVAIGCLVVFALAAVVVGVVGYYAYTKTKGMVASFAQLQEIPKVEAQVRNKATYAAPETGELSEAQVTRFVAVQQTIKERLGARLKDLDAKYETLNKKNGGDASITEGLAALQDLGSLVLEAKKVQVEALNAQGFSLSEYAWARTAIYQAAGVPLSVELDKIIKSAQTGQAPTHEAVAEAFTGVVPDANKQLVAPHVERLRENAGLAFFGL